MTVRSSSMSEARRSARRFWRDRTGTSAVEFAIVALPMLVLLLSIVQIGIYYMTQAALDAGVTRTADAMRSGFNTGTPSMPGATALKTNVATNAGGMVRNDSTLAVDLRQQTALALAAVPITDGTADYGLSTSVLVLRAKSSVYTFAPGMSGMLQASSSALIKRQSAQ